MLLDCIAPDNHSMNAVSREYLEQLLKATTDSTEYFVEAVFISVQGCVNYIFAENFELKSSSKFTQVELREVQEVVNTKAGFIIAV